MPKNQKSKPPVVPCEVGSALKQQIDDFAEVLRTEAHKIGSHGMTEEQFYSSGILDGAIQRIRGQYSATMRDKRDFIAQILRHMEDGGFIKEWEAAGSNNRYDYSVMLPSGRITAIEAKGCMDGNNVNIFKRPLHAQEFVIWSLCPNGSSDLRHNVWSGISRLGNEIVETQSNVDGVVVWDWVCGSLSRPCPKLRRLAGREITIGQFKLPPPCIYLFPKSVPTVRSNPNPEPHKLEGVGFLEALNSCFGGYFDEINHVRFAVAHEGSETVKATSIERAGIIQQASKPKAIER